MRLSHAQQFAVVFVLIAVLGAGAPAAAVSPQPAAPATTLVIDHNNADISQVPAGWIEQARDQFRLSYGHTSHGSQLVSGMWVLRNVDVLYNYNQNGSLQTGTLSLHDSYPPGDLGNPDRVTWAQLTRDYLNSGSPPGNNRNMVMWSWCGQANTPDPANIDLYLNLMNQLETDYPNVQFIYMTGHLAGTGPTGDLYLRNNQIRNYARANGKILFDFADIESYDPAGNYYPDGSDACEWCTSWCANPAHQAECDLAATMGDCAHSHPLNCYRKGQAVWWMLARLAGWPGPGLAPRLYFPVSVFNYQAR